MQYHTYFAVVLVSLSATQLNSVTAHEHEKAPAAVPYEVTYRSTAMPERVLLGWKGDTATSQAVTWRTDTSVEHSYGQITIAEDGPLFVAKAKAAQVEATTTTLVETDLGPRHYHALNFTGLKPDTLYVYRVGDRTNWTPWMHFRTASAEFQPFSFVYFGDAQNSLKEHWSRVFREAYADAPRAGFMLHAGDLVNTGPSDREWGEWCAAGGWVNGTIPTIAIPGNHEYFKIYPDPNSKDDFTEHLVRHWQDRFEFPENGPRELLESCYYLDYQGVRIIGMNSMEDFALQAKWLEDVLADNPCRWTIVTHHHPVFSGKANRDNPELRDAWQPLYDKYQVDMVLTGHDHSYARTGLTGYQKNIPTGVRAQSKKGGTVYVVSVSGPKHYDSSADYPFVRRAEDTQLYQVISVNKNQIKYEAKTAVGKLYDAFTLKKRKGQTNELIEQVPETPENFRKPKEQ